MSTTKPGPATSAAAHALGAQAFAFGDSVAFASPPDLHTAAHEAAHVVQQRGGVQLKGGIDQPGDTHERHADAVADAVVAGRSAALLLDQVSRARSPGAAVQRKPDGPSAASGGASPAVVPPKGGINKIASSMPTGGVPALAVVTFRRRIPMARWRLTSSSTRASTRFRRGPSRR